MASETVKKVLEAEAESDRIIAEANARSEDIIAEAEGASSREIQDSITRARTEADRLRAENADKIKQYREKCDKQCEAEKEKMKKLAESNMQAAVDSVIDTFFGD